MDSQLTALRCLGHHSTQRQFQPGDFVFNSAVTYAREQVCVPLVGPVLIRLISCDNRRSGHGDHSSRLRAGGTNSAEKTRLPSCVGGFPSPICGEAASYFGPPFAIFA